MDLTSTPRKFWEHPDPKNTAMWAFMQAANAKFGQRMDDFASLHKWGCENRNDFWTFAFERQNAIYEGSYTRAVDESVPISQVPRWFEGVRLNWAENFLWSRGAGDDKGARTTLHKEDDKLALLEVREGGTEVRRMNWRELRRSTAELAAALAARGVAKGDRVVMVGAHQATTLQVFLATTWLGGVFSSSSTDMGIGGLLQRTEQIDPKFVFFDDGALYNGKKTDLRGKLAAVTEGLKKTCPSFKKTIVVRRFSDDPYPTGDVPHTERLDDFLASRGYATAPELVRVDFSDPVMVYYSSGTTGTPKAIVHGVGPLLLNLHKEGVLHRCATPNDVNLQYTTTGWIMYLSSVSQMLLGGASILYDGSPFLPDPKVLLRIAADHGATRLGISPRWMAELKKLNIRPREVADLSKLRSVVTTGMVLPDHMFDWFYDEAFPPHVQLSNISGGTDIAGCFVTDNPLMPVHRGGCVAPSLAVPMAVFDNDIPEGGAGRPLPDGQAGHLVATTAFPNIPVFLWNDGDGTGTAPGPKYRGAYFERFANVWAQGDFCVIHPVTKSILMLGRADGVLNPSGVRFGSSDIYSVLEKRFTERVAESICVGQRRPTDSDETVVLFLLMRPGQGPLDKKLVKDIRAAIASDLTKRHVPRYIFEVPEIPTTVNGKKVELPIKAIISGKTVKPSGTLLNPQSLDFYYRFQKIEDLVEPQAKL